MVKKRIPKKVEKKISAYLKVLREDKLPIKKVVLFGSYAKGTQHKWSDIDLCVISPKFENSFDAMQYLWLRRIDDAGLTIEPVGFNSKDFNNKYSSFINEIKKTGIEISV
ncbi:MAG: nucleotidyltransferase domain-containing protein [Candidatus Pacebacteria bacterium]|nr:nucleotidyltransferase domain-containing protein [Candidatus Paceibacterota bacterium]